MRLLVLVIRWTGGSPASIQVVRRCPVHQRMELGAVGHGRPNDYGVDGLGLNANGSLWSRHLLPSSVIRPRANLKRALNPQDAKVFPQVRFRMSRFVASL